jgi:hypothetical protein
MAASTSSISIPGWVKEFSPRPKKYIKGLFKTLAFLKMKEYERQSEIFRRKYKTSLNRFEKRMNAQKKESFNTWDDYLLWKGLEGAHQKWERRYREL